MTAEEPTGKATSREQGEATEAGLTAGEPTGKGEGTRPPKAPPVKRAAVLPEPEGPASPLTAPKGTPEREGLQLAPKTKAPCCRERRVGRRRTLALRWWVYRSPSQR